MSSIIDPLFGAVMFFVLLVSLFAGYTIFKNLDAQGVFGQYSGALGMFYDSMANVGIFIELAIALAAIVSAYLIRTNPIFFFLTIFFLFIQIIVVVPLVNTFSDVSANPQFADANAKFNLLVVGMNNLPIFTLFSCVIAALLGIVGGKST